MSDETVPCEGCDTTIEEPTDDHEENGTYWCHNCAYLAMFDRGPLADLRRGEAA